MTLDEAIQHCKEVAIEYEAKGECNECGKEHRQLAEWLEDYKELKADYIEVDKQLRTANTENDELKRLLKLAVYDLDTAIKSCKQDMLCEICSYHEKCDYINYCGGEYDRTWKHHDEAMKLLGAERTPLPEMPKGDTT